MLLIYDACRYQKAWDLESTSPWCAAFAADNLKVTVSMSVAALIELNQLKPTPSFVRYSSSVRIF